MTVYHQREPAWLEAVKDLRPGEKRRVGDGVLISFNGQSYLRYDFREKSAEVYQPTLSLAERLEITRALREAEQSAILDSRLPPLMLHPSDWPSEARVWLYRADVDNNEIQALGIGWWPAARRVVTPLNMLGGGKHWIARALDTSLGQQKYLFPRGVGNPGAADFPAAPVTGPDEPIVLTEDWLSAYRVSRDTGVNAAALLGTSASRDTLVQVLRRHPRNIITWLDPDEWGQRGARELRKKLLALGAESVRNITSEHDPKLHTAEELRSYLKEV